MGRGTPDRFRVASEACDSTGTRERALNEPEQNVFAWLDRIRARPAMWLRKSALRELQPLTFGYYCGLREHGIVESVPDFGQHFNDWLYYRTGWSCCQGWEVAFEQRYQTSEEAFVAFFEFVDEFRKLRPTLLCTVKLAARHKPTGKRVRFGLNGLMDKPIGVEVFRYRPEPLHFLRFHFPKRMENSHLLMTGSGNHATTLRFAKEWVRDELQVEFAAWKPVGNRC